MNKKFFGLSLPMLLFTCIIVVVATKLGVLSSDLAGGIALMLAIGIILYELGEVIPIWNTYIGGGILLAFLGTAVLVHFNVIPEDYVELMNSVTSKPMRVLNLFIIVLITGSILGLNRNLMLKSFIGYIPAILGGLVGAAVLGILGGLIFNVSPSETLLKYVLPVMGGGNGAGAVPLSQIYEKVTHNPAEEYYGFAIAILTIANIFAIVAAAILDKVGNAKQNLTGDKSTLMRKSDEITVETEEVQLELKDYCGALLLSVSFYQLGRIFSESIWPHVSEQIPIHQFAWMILFVAIANGSGLIPNTLRHACKNMQSFFTKNIILIIMVGVGASTNLADLASAITFGNSVMALLIVIGAILGSALLGYFVGFYPIDSAITAGLCMANRGGSGDLAVLGAGNRMGLIAYAQLSSRLGGGIVLVIGSILFGLLS
ncbi:MAG: 2-hydroxycarboxylate transporter family protein [Tissierellia bacterium]|nr:2-hydroxycarboxylate transporter family protein [Tissierellia bacterium]